MSDSVGVVVLYGMLGLWALMLLACLVGVRIWSRLMDSRLRRIVVVVAARPLYAALVGAVAVTTVPLWWAAISTHPDGTPWIVYTVTIQGVAAVPAFWLVLAVLTTQARVALYRARPDLVGLRPGEALAALEDFHPQREIAATAWEARVSSSRPPSLTEVARSTPHFAAVRSLRPTPSVAPHMPLHQVLTGIGELCLIILFVIAVAGRVAGVSVDALAPVLVVMMVGAVTLVPLGGLLRRRTPDRNAVGLGATSVASELGLLSRVVDSGAQDVWLQMELQGFLERLPDNELTGTLWTGEARVGAVRLIDVEGLATFTAVIATHPDRRNPRFGGRMAVAGAVLPERLPGDSYVCVLPRWMSSPAEGQYFVGSREFNDKFATLASGESALHATLTAQAITRLDSLDGAVALLAADRWVLAICVRPSRPEAEDVLHLVVVEAVTELARQQSSM